MMRRQAIQINKPWLLHHLSFCAPAQRCRAPCLPNGLVQNVRGQICSKKGSGVSGSGSRHSSNALFDYWFEIPRRRRSFLALV